MAYAHKLLAGGAALMLVAACNQTPPPEPVTEQSMSAASSGLVPGGPWQDGDERGMANTLGEGTWMRCAHYMSQPGARSTPPTATPTPLTKSRRLIARRIPSSRSVKLDIPPPIHKHRYCTGHHLFSSPTHMQTLHERCRRQTVGGE